MFNLRYDIPTTFSEAELETIRIGLGYPIETLKDDTRNLVAWWKDGIITKISKIMGVTLKEELRNNSILEDLDRYRYVDIDFLGFGIVAPKRLETVLRKQIVYPTLSRERLHKALMYSKAEYGL